MTSIIVIHVDLITLSIAIDPYGHCGFSGLVALHPYLGVLNVRALRDTMLSTEDYSCQKYNNDIFRNFWSVPTAEARRVGDEFSISFY